MKKIILISICWLIFGAAHAQQIYVSSARGDNSNNGTKESPLATLEAARDLVRHYKTTKQQGDIIVLIEEGIYHQSQPLVFNDLDSGQPGSAIIWRAVEGHQVRVTGGKNISYDKFRKVTDSKILKRLSREAITKVLQVDLAKMGLTDYGNEKQYGHALPVVTAPLELFCNDKAMTVARYPNQGNMKIGKVINKGSVPRTGDYSEQGGVFEYTDPRHERWAGQEDVWFQGTFCYGFADDNLPVEKIDTKSKSVKMASPHMYGIGSGQDYQHYFAKNILDELDMPEEWYLDKRSGILYFWPPSTLNSESRITVSILEDPIISIEGASHLTIENLIVEVGRGIGVYMERCNYVTIAGCTVRNMGTSGIFMGQGARQKMSYITHEHYDGVPISRRVENVQGHIYKYTHWDRKGGYNNAIQSCDVYNTGSGGIYLSGGSKAKLIPGNNYIDNCKIHNYNRRNKFLWAGINVDGCANRVSHCEVFDSEWQGIYVHGNDHLFQYNEIHHVTVNSNDTSPWYIGRDPSDRGNVVRYNYIHHCGNKDRMTMGIYCDDSTTDVTVFGNVFYKMNTNHGVMFSNTGWDLRFINNIVVEPISSTVFISAHYYTWAVNEIIPAMGENGYIRKRLTHNINIYKPPYSDRYPGLINYLDPIVPGKEWEGNRARRNTMSRNLIVFSKEPPLKLSGKYSQCDDVDNLNVSDDPGFVDLKNENFMLRSDSEVFKKIKGFEPIPFDKMGRYNDEYTKDIDSIKQCD